METTMKIDESAPKLPIHIEYVTRGYEFNGVRWVRVAGSIELDYWARPREYAEFMGTKPVFIHDD